MWRITVANTASMSTHKFTLAEVLVLAAMNVMEAEMQAKAEAERKLTLCKSK